eukprot:TRINITY_DN14441_c0_g1_i1.p1 TRINITY_DN14441_c0_g1~~TRINITY_DN14441_c0_g1_i1.p1  ORF type:complete len:185 (-),score=26.55 TRINITY_DN14441_c0_g1_i1:267-821(-)
MNVVRICVVGTGAVGKSALTMQLVMSKFVEEYDPTIQDSYRKQLSVDGKQYMLEIQDTAGQEEYTALQSQLWEEAEGYILVFSIASKVTFIDICRLRDAIAATKPAGTRIPMILVGNKRDLDEEREVSATEAELTAKRWGCPYMEASAMMLVNVVECFRECVREVLRIRRGSDPVRDDKRCVLL